MARLKDKFFKEIVPELKEEFGYVPKLSSAEVFEVWRASRQWNIR